MSRNFCHLTKVLVTFFLFGAQTRTSSHFFRIEIFFEMALNLSFFLDFSIFGDASKLALKKWPENGRSLFFFTSS